MQLFPCPLKVLDFTTDKKTKCYIAEASDLGFRPGQVPGGRLYDDAADFGITLYNAGGQQATFYGIEGGNEVFVYRPTAETLRAYPKLEGWEVHILND